jgi:hypothetical protein
VVTVTPIRKRAIATASLCLAASLLFLAPGMYFESADVSALMVFCALVIPAGVAGLFWAVTWPQARDLGTRVSWPPRAGVSSEHVERAKAAIR